MSDRRPPEITESIAEALRAGLALMTVVLLARANAGALTRAPSAWVALPVCLIAWTAAAWAVRWTPSGVGSRLAVWRDCVAPALISFVIAGRGGAGSLPIALGLVVLGVVAVGLAAVCCRQATGVCEPITVELEPRPANETTVHETVTEDPIAPTPQLACAPVSPDEAGTPHFPLPTPPEVASPTDMAEIVESSVDESIPTESWNRTESDGQVSIEAVIHARFEEGAKLAVLHLPFVPPLPTVPQVECEPLDSGCEVTIQTEATYRHGVRLSVTRPSTGPAESVPIGVMVYTSAEDQVE